jgi:transmembrane sensor
MSSNLGRDRISIEVLDAVQRSRQNLSTSAEFLGVATKSPEHVDSALSYAALYEIGDGLGDRTRTALREILARDVAAGLSEAGETGPALREPLRPIRRPGSRVRRWRWTKVAAALAATSIIAVTAITLTTSRGVAAQVYTTGVGATMNVPLSDGTVVVLNTDSRIEVRFSEALRQIRLVRGEIRSEVSPDAERPFIVDAGTVNVRALGTTFNVYRAPGFVNVAVEEGGVTVNVGESTAAPEGSAEPAGTRVAANSGIRVDNNGELTQLTGSALANAFSWRERRLVFDGDKLADIAGEFNRYNAAPKIYVDGAARDRQFSGVFDAMSPRAFADLVANSSNFEVTRKDGEIRISVR